MSWGIYFHSCFPGFVYYTKNGYQCPKRTLLYNVESLLRLVLPSCEKFENYFWRRHFCCFLLFYTVFLYGNKRLWFLNPCRLLCIPFKQSIRDVRFQISVCFQKFSLYIIKKNAVSISRQGNTKILKGYLKVLLCFPKSVLTLLYIFLIRHSF